MNTPTLISTPDPEDPNEVPAVNTPGAADNVVPLRPVNEAHEHPNPGTTLEPKVYEAELLSPEESAALDRRRAGKALVRVSPAEHAARIVRVIRESERTARIKSVAAYRARKAPADVLRLTWFAVRGHGRWVRKAWDFFTYADLRADARAARMAGDAEARREAQELIRSDARARWAKVGIVLRRIANTAFVAGLLALLLWMAGVIDSVIDPDHPWAWRAAVVGVLGTVASVLGTVLPWLLTLGPLGWLVAAIWEGRDKTPGAGFLVRPDRDDSDSWIDERMISQALAHLGIPALAQFFKNGGALVYTVAARKDGDGTFAQVRLPMGVTAEMVAGQRSKLAANLGRSSLETWPTKGEEDGILDLWVADKGKLSGGAGPWPLQDDGEVDMFDGVPFGLTQRGIVINAPLFESNWLIGGRPGQGKSAAMRTLLLGAALDPTCELWVFVMGESPDFDPFKPRLSRYQMGMDDSVAEAALTGLEDLLSEMERRGKVLGQQPGKPPKISRKLADKRGLGLHPLVYAIDECHELFQHPKYGKRAEELAVRLIKRGRKYGIILILATQSPTKDSIPKEVTRNVSCGVAFAVADHVANDGLLGSGKYRAGIRATELRMKTDRGTCVAVGVTDETFELVRTFYVPFEDEIDMVTPAIHRAMALIAEAGRTVPATGRDRAEAETPAEAVDHLADVAEVLGTDKRVRTQVVLTRLVEHNPAEYEGWTFQDLKAALAECGVEPVKSEGVMVVRADDITTALTERDENGSAEDTSKRGS